MDKTNNYAWLVPALVAFVLIIGSFITQWATTRAAVASVQSNQDKIDARVVDSEKRIQIIEVGAAVSNSDVETIKRGIEEIKKDIKEILKNQK